MGLVVYFNSTFLADPLFPGRAGGGILDGWVRSFGGKETEKPEGSLGDIENLDNLEFEQKPETTSGKTFFLAL